MTFLFFDIIKPPEHIVLVVPEICNLLKVSPKLLIPKSEYALINSDKRYKQKGDTK